MSCRNFFLNKFSNDSCAGCEYIRKCIKDKVNEKEKPMNKVIFESEYQLNDFRKHLKLYENVTEDQLMEILKREGYIRKSPVEEAEEMLYDWKAGHTTDINDMVVKAIEAIHNLKAENERLKK